MPIVTPSYYFAGANDGSWSKGFENSDVAINRANNTNARDLNNSNHDFQGAQNMYDRMFQGQQADATRGFNASQSAATRDFQGAQAAADRGFQGQQNDANRSLQQQLGLAPIEFQREKFNAIQPYINNLLGGLSGGAGSGTFGTIGGSASAQPNISADPIYSQGMIDQQVNQAKANNAQQTATANRGVATKLAGQGFGSRSPLLASLQSQNQAAQMGSDATSENAIRFGSAKANSEQVLKGQTAQESAWNDYQDQDIRRRQTQVNGINGLLASLGGLI